MTTARSGNTVSSLMTVRAAIRSAADPVYAEKVRRFFKTGPGEYGEGDIFIGVRVPVLRKIAACHRDISLDEITALLCSPVHEDRMTALIFLTLRFKKATQEEQKKIYTIYMEHTRYINNWDLVDISAPYIPGAYLFPDGKSELTALVKSKNLWERRIAIVSAYYFIKNRAFNPVITLSEMLLADREDLLHKAAGWMLREAGKRDIKVLTDFLDKHCRNMPRTMLRYAVEKLPERMRKRYRTAREV